MWTSWLAYHLKVFRKPHSTQERKEKKYFEISLAHSILKYLSKPFLVYQTFRG
jgi:hypothetical protein